MEGPEEDLPRVAPGDVPHFATEDEEADFWSEHDSSLLMDQGEDVSDRPPAALRRGPGRKGSRALKRPEGQRMKLVSLYLPEELIAGVKQLAAERQGAYQALMRAWLSDRLDAERFAREAMPLGGGDAPPLLLRVLSIERSQLAVVEELSRVIEGRVSGEPRAELAGERARVIEESRRSATMGEQIPTGGGEPEPPAAPRKRRGTMPPR